MSRVLPFHVFGAFFVRFGFLVLMCFYVFGQVVAPHEPLAAVGTGEALLSGVCPQVPLQLVGACETFPAEEPVAHERSLSGVPAKVRFQVRRLAVNFAAAGDVAHVLLLFPRFVARAGRLTVRAATPAAPAR